MIQLKSWWILTREYHLDLQVDLNSRQNQELSVPESNQYLQSQMILEFTNKWAIYNSKSESLIMIVIKSFLMMKKRHSQ